MNGKLFQLDERQVFGCFHERVGTAEPRYPVLICPPLGHEYYKSHWCIRRLTTTLTRSGFSVCRFDYSGTGDSGGSLEDVPSIQQWMDDAYGMAKHLCRSEQTDRVHVLGLRTGALFAAAVAATGIAEELVLWEPALNAQAVINQWRSMHETMVDLWMTKIETPNNDEHEEILGAPFPRQVIRELESFRFGARSDLTCRNATVVTADAKADWVQLGYEQIQAKETTDWDQLSMIEQAWLPTESPNKIREVLAQAATVKHVQPVA